MLVRKKLRTITLCLRLFTQRSSLYFGRAIFSLRLCAWAHIPAPLTNTCFAVFFRANLLIIIRTAHNSQCCHISLTTTPTTSQLSNWQATSSTIASHRQHRQQTDNKCIANRRMWLHFLLSCRQLPPPLSPLQPFICTSYLHANTQSEFNF